ncbi:cyclic nucleotide-binding domain-containing protein [Parafrankia elaeagni]|uniref:cyclic nucleotide-binding domain-containing protein n=1 Tax=Parafrankia elaeagni TaxID=222534 RepID=UPI00035E5D59|nr:cyclic nucleotide-binding domain-containing protein [Parafrankia elaeagni]
MTACHPPSSPAPHTASVTEVAEVAAFTEVTAFAEVAAFAGMRPEHLAVLDGCAHEMTFGTGEVLFREGEVADTLHLVRAGTVAIEMFVPARGAITIETVGAGDVVGWSWLFPPYRLRFDARALTAVETAAVGAGCLRARIAEDPELGCDLLFHLARVLAGRLSATRMRLLDVYRNPARS